MAHCEVSSYNSSCSQDWPNCTNFSAAKEVQFWPHLQETSAKEEFAALLVLVGHSVPGTVGKTLTLSPSTSEHR